jgi:lysyl-tRNA synthetase class 2
VNSLDSALPLRHGRRSINNGLELANGFSELTDASEQRHRLETESAYRKKIGKTVFDLDEDFVEAVGMMPPSAGIALGVDRLVQILTGCQNINDVLVLPASQLFRT